MAKKKRVPVIEPVVDATDAEIAALEAEIAGDDPGDSNDTAAAPTGETILTEDNGRIAVQPGQHQQFRVQAVSGEWFDHCANHPKTGEWVYRSVNA